MHFRSGESVTESLSLKLIIIIASRPFQPKSHNRAGLSVATSCKTLLLQPFSAGCSSAACFAGMVHGTIRSGGSALEDTASDGNPGWAEVRSGIIQLADLRVGLPEALCLRLMALSVHRSQRRRLWFHLDLQRLIPVSAVLDRPAVLQPILQGQDCFPVRVPRRPTDFHPAKEAVRAWAAVVYKRVVPRADRRSRWVLLFQKPQF